MDDSNVSHKEWFEEWFDTKWYHILYKDRNWLEARGFIATLMTYLNPSKEALILDAACGSGRHSIQLNELGYNVRGFDLSSNSISEAKTHENERLKFSVADLREFQTFERFDVILNLFTSFGYFQSHEDNYEVLRKFHEHLQPNGVVVIDFLNVNAVAANLVEKESKIVDGYEFAIEREITESHIIKRIALEENGTHYHFEERVSAFTHPELIDMLNSCGFQVKAIFGTYDLDPFHESESPRLIIAAVKK